MANPSQYLPSAAYKKAGILVVQAFLPGATAATAANYGVFFIAPYKCKVLSAKERHRTVGSDGGTVTVNIEKVPSGTAEGSGTALATALSLKATVNTNQSFTLVSTEASTELATGDALALTDAGTLTAVADVCITVELCPIP